MNRRRLNLLSPPQIDTLVHRELHCCFRPTKLGQKRDEDAEDGEEDNEVLITLTSRNPNDSFAQIW